MSPALPESLHAAFAGARARAGGLPFLAESACSGGRAWSFEQAGRIKYDALPRLERELATAQEGFAAAQKDGGYLKEEVTAESIAEIVAKWTGVPVSKMLEGEQSKLLRMEEQLARRVVGQREAVVAVANAVRRARAGLGDERRPIGSFLFQPSEFVKLSLMLAVARYVHRDNRGEKWTLRDIVVPGALIALPLGLIMAQPDLGTALIVGLVSASVMALVRIERNTIRGNTSPDGNCGVLVAGDSPWTVVSGNTIDCTLTPVESTTSAISLRHWPSGTQVRIERNTVIGAVSWRPVRRSTLCAP